MWYLCGMAIFFGYWLLFFLKDNTTPKNHLLSWIVLITATAIWPLSGTLAIVELINKARNKQNELETEIIEAHDLSQTVSSNQSKNSYNY